MHRFGFLALGMLLLVLIPASSVGATDRNVLILGADRFVANTLVMSDFRFDPGPLGVSTGETVTWTNRTDEAHTVSIVPASVLPTSFDAIFACLMPPAGACVPFLINPVQNVGASGLDQPGDSLLVLPGQSVAAAISAPAGSTLSYLCAFHPWMQGSLRVN